MEISRRRTGGTAINLHSFLPPSLHSDAIADTIKSFFPNNYGEDDHFPWFGVECSDGKMLPLSERADLSAGSSGGSVSDAKPSASSSGASTAKVSTDKYRNFAVVAGVITTTASLGWSPKASRKKEEVQD
ncbi:hypothetical protein ACFX2I_013345 [Malus domestica]